MTSPVLHHRFIEPLDVLFLRGNKLFGDPGSHGESLIPPWPSAAAGALRSAMLARQGIDLDAFAQGHIGHPTLGTPAAPGAFTVTRFTLARRLKDGGIESLHALPADLLAEEADTPPPQDPDAKSFKLRRLAPALPAAGLLSSAPLSHWPILAQADRSKSSAGCWLTQAGWAAYLAGRTPASDQVWTTGRLWQLDVRVGVGLDPERRRAADGQLFSAQAVAFKPGVGFLASVLGAEPPADGLLRLGGDGRGTAIRSTPHQAPAADLSAIAQARRARMVLTTPGLFEAGWLPTGISRHEDGSLRLDLHGVRARLACAAVQRADVISGWDLAQRQPKAAERVAPAGSVYWLDALDATPQALGKLAEQGLWTSPDQNPSRRAEGFNRFDWAAW